MSLLPIKRKAIPTTEKTDFKKKQRLTPLYNPFQLLQMLGVDMYPKIVTHISDMFTFRNFCLSIAAIEDGISLNTILSYFFKSNIIKPFLNIENKFLYSKYLLYTAYVKYQNYKKSESIEFLITMTKNVYGRLCPECNCLTSFYIMYSEKYLFIYSLHPSTFLPFIIEDINNTDKSSLLKLLDDTLSDYNVDVIDILKISSGYYVLIIVNFFDATFFFYNLYCDSNYKIINLNEMHFTLHDLNTRLYIKGLLYNSNLITLLFTDRYNHSKITFEYYIPEKNFIFSICDTFGDLVLDDKVTISFKDDYLLRHKIDVKRCSLSSYKKWKEILDMCFKGNKIPNIFLMSVDDKYAYYLFFYISEYNHCYTK